MKPTEYERWERIQNRRVDTCYLDDWYSMGGPSTYRDPEKVAPSANMTGKQFRRAQKRERMIERQRQEAIWREVLARQAERQQFFATIKAPDAWI